MMTKTTALPLKLPLTVDLLAGFLESVMDETIMPFRFDEDVQFRIKWVLTELATNTYKHGDIASTFLSLEVNQPEIIIKKIDVSETPFFYTQCNLNNNTKTHIYDCSDALYVKRINNTTIQFIESDFIDLPADIETLCEHFGLLIITRSCDLFTFSYNTDTKENTFKAIISNKVF